MERRTSAFARIFALLALALAVVAVVAVISSTAGDDSAGSGKGSQQTRKHAQPKTKAATYVVEPGDTLISIAHETGIPVRQIETLNPEVDPQILIAGEKLKLR